MCLARVGKFNLLRHFVRCSAKCQVAKLTKNNKILPKWQNCAQTKVNQIYPFAHKKVSDQMRGKMAKSGGASIGGLRLAKMRKILDFKRKNVKLCELVAHLTRTTFYGMILQ